MKRTGWLLARLASRQASSAQNAGVMSACSGVLVVKNLMFTSAADNTLTCNMPVHRGFACSGSSGSSSDDDESSGLGGQNYLENIVYPRSQVECRSVYRYGFI